ncbi:N-acetylmuramoyl-L-alanine amidase family protein [Sporosarcina jiandibaonis]|uniref:N-acetylmuramoyl-L-alanine amidase family protein n=1 Tax=Sporosarcina jiandibaonis TaxID=2715535 RepID=UPI0015559515|nr:N-acetylmuramoyl-L-alanine amidase [Sporosarcina jiandibaonis]
MVKIVIDAGLGLKSTSETDDDWNCNDMVVRTAIKKLKTYKGVEVLRVDDPSGKSIVSLKERARMANEWNADVYVSIHHGANLKTKDITAAFTPRIVKAMGDREGGLKQTSFHVLRDTKFPAIFTGAGFSNSVVDIIKICNQNYLRSEGEAIAEGLAAYINLLPSHMKSKVDSQKLTSREFVSAATTILRHLESDRKGIIPEKWLKNIQDGSLADSDAIGLLYVVLHRWLSS